MVLLLLVFIGLLVSCKYRKGKETLSHFEKSCKTVGIFLHETHPHPPTHCIMGDLFSSPLTKCFLTDYSLVAA